MAQYHGRDFGAMRERATGDGAASPAIAPRPSAFTAINRNSGEPLTPQPSISSTQNCPRSSPRRTTSKRNPAVAQYLGIGALTEPAHLEKYAPFPPTPESPPKATKRQRTRKSNNGSTLFKGENAAVSERPQQRRISDGLRVTKPASGRAPKSTQNGAPVPPPLATYSPAAPSHQAANEPQAYWSSSRNASPGKTVRAATQKDRTSNNPDITATNSVSTEESVRINADYNLDVITSDEDDVFDDGLEDADFLMLTCDELVDFSSEANELEKCISSSQVEQIEGPNSTLSRQSMAEAISSFRKPKGPHGPTMCQHWRCYSSSTYASPPASPTSTRSSITLKTSSPPGPSEKFVSPLTLKTRVLVQKDDPNSGENHKPIVRPQFPTPVRDRSPITGLSPDTILRTCFRIGEAINQACHAAKHGQSIIFELYARVLTSTRDDTKQHFVFCDLFHTKPPYIKAAYEAAIWKSVELFNYDSGRLLQEGKICRSMGKMKRDGKEWTMVVLNIWQATWEDISWVEGIVNA